MFPSPLLSEPESLTNSATSSESTEVSTEFESADPSASFESFAPEPFDPSDDSSLEFVSPSLLLSEPDADSSSTDWLSSSDAPSSDSPDSPDSSD